MLLKLFMLMTLIPILEIMLLLQIHGQLASFLGSGQALLITIGSVLLTGFIGANLARSQGFQVLSRIQGNMSRGQMPGDDLLDGVMILVGGVFLLTPGYATDLLGFFLMIPTTRALLKSAVISWFKEQIAKGTVNVYYSSQSNSGYHGGSVDSFHTKENSDPNIVDVKPISDRSDP